MVQKHAGYGRRYFLKSIYLLLLGVLASCASQRGAVREAAPETALEKAVRRVKENRADIAKYVMLDENGGIIVKADLDAGVTAVYDLKHAEPDGAGGFAVPFSARAEDGTVQYDWLHWTLQEDAAGILLAFDDDYQEVWERNLDLFDQYGAKVTFFVQGRLCDFCTLALRRGHDVGYHSLNHLNLPKVSTEVFVEETLSAVDEFRQAGVPLTSFAYPYGLSEAWMHEELLKTFKLLRGYGVTFRVYDRETIQKGYISSKALDTILFKEDVDFEATVDLMFRALKFIGGDRILPLTTHTISDTADWGIKPRRLVYLLQAAGDMKLKFYRFKDVQ